MKYLLFTAFAMILSFSPAFARDIALNAHCTGPHKMLADVYTKYPEGSVKIDLEYDALFKDQNVRISFPGQPASRTSGFFSSREDHMSFPPSCTASSYQVKDLIFDKDCETNQIINATLFLADKTSLYFICHL